MPTWKVTVKALKEDKDKKLVRDPAAGIEETHLSGDYKTADDVKKFAAANWKHLEFVSAAVSPAIHETPPKVHITGQEIGGGKYTGKILTGSQKTEK